MERDILKQAGWYSGKNNLYWRNRNKWKIIVMCRLLEVSRSYFYKVMKLKDTVTSFKQKHSSLDNAVLKAFDANYEIYGFNKIVIF